MPASKKTIISSEQPVVYVLLLHSFNVSVPFFPFLLLHFSISSFGCLHLHFGLRLSWLILPSRHFSHLQR